MHHGKNIAKLRLSKNQMKQEELAVLLNTTQQRVSKLENTEQLKPTTLKKVAKILDVSINEITGESIPKKKTTATKNKVVSNNSDKKILGKLVDVLLHLVKK